MSSTLTNLTHKQLFITDCVIKNSLRRDENLKNSESFHDVEAIPTALDASISNEVKKSKISKADWGKEILITDKDLLNQVRKVLRLQKGDTIYVQNEGIRYEVEIKDRDDKTLKGEIKKETRKTENGERKTGMIVGMPNKWEKVELIVQKLTEIGLDEIIFRPSERSVIKTWNENKSERLQKIAREAVEQSWGRKLPNIEFVTDVRNILKDKSIIVFDKMDNGKRKTDNEEVMLLTVNRSSLTVETFGLVGPEGGLTERDYESLKGINYEVRELGETMLRTETAAIVGGWLIRNSKF